MSTKNGKKGGHGCLVAALATVLVMAVVGAVHSHFGGFGTGPSADPDEFAQYAAPVEDIAIPDGTRVVALGEATHGNQEFQQLKLDVFKVLVEKYGVRAFALEADFGGCEVVNRYIHGGEGTQQEAVQALTFHIYQTDQMAEIISWMRAYNQTAAPDQDLRFYGFDMQSYEHSYGLLLQEMQWLGLDTAEIESLWDGDDYAQDVDADRCAAVYADVRDEIQGLEGTEDVSLVLQLVDVLLQNVELGKVYETSDGYGVRDDSMAQNVLWILDQEQQRGNQCIFISAHNGHIEQFGSYGPDAKVMGNLLADQLGDAYYAIGTDFFKAEVNLPKNDGRMTHVFYSYDPLAKAAHACGFETCWLDFSQVPDDSSLRAYIDGPIMMGWVGEGFSPLMLVLPQAYRVKREPSSPFDSMIFVSNAHPTVIAEQ